MATEMEVIRKAADKVADAYDADVLFYNGPIWRHNSDAIVEHCMQRQKRPNVFLVLTTDGGDPHAAYRIARTLQQHYKRFIAFVPGYCKSAGTLLVLGANELIMGPYAELGPLDLQVRSKDEVGERSSVLTPTDALRVMQTQAINSFIGSFVELRVNAELPTRLAAEMSATLVAGMYKEVFAQVDPMRLGEMERANRIAIEYGERLIAKGKNTKNGTLIKLVVGYPSHGFVIDQAEASELFDNIRESTGEEQLLGANKPLSDEKTFVFFLNSTPTKTVTGSGSHDTDGAAEKSDDEGADSGDRVGESKTDSQTVGGTAEQNGVQGSINPHLGNTEEAQN